MPAEVIAMKPTCRRCSAALSIDEIHYYDHGNGEATCNKCEREWLDAMELWRSGFGGKDPPPQP